MINKNLIKKNSTVIVSFSGGPDSVYLLHALHALRSEKNIMLIAAHLDHEWRTNSGEDVIFCKKFCESLNIPFFSKKISELNITIKQTGSQEDAARRYRQAFLMEILKTHNADAIALGHHADDQIETFFIRLIRGTTPSGLQCMKRKNGLFIRPLLQVKKRDILIYLKSHELEYLTDPTNSCLDYLRNRIRTTLLPTLQNVDKRSEHNILRAIDAIQENEILLNEFVENIYKSIILEKTLNIKIFRTLSLSLQKKIIQLWICKETSTFTLTESFIKEILRFLDSDRGGTHVLGTWSIVKKSGRATICKTL